MLDSSNGSGKQSDTFSLFLTNSVNVHVSPVPLSVNVIITSAEHVVSTIAACDPIMGSGSRFTTVTLHSPAAGTALQLTSTCLPPAIACSTKARQSSGIDSSTIKSLRLTTQSNSLLTEIHSKVRTTSVVTVAVTGGVLSACAVALLVTVPSNKGMTVMTIVCSCCPSNVPKKQVTVCPDTEQVPPSD